MPIELDDLMLALDFVSNDFSDDNEALISIDTGEIYFLGDEIDDEDVPDDIEESDRYVEAPHKRDLDLGNQLVFDFVAQNMPDDYDRVRGMFRRRGAYGRFKSFLDSKNRLDEWHRYEADRTMDELLVWCRDNLPDHLVPDRTLPRRSQEQDADATAVVRRGSCLCGDVAFAVTGAIEGVGRCHCSQCRKVSGTNGNAVFLVPKSRFEWTSGEEHTRKFSLASGWSVLRCQRCGSPLPQSHDGERVWVHAGLMDDDLGTEIRRHIFCGSRADWDREARDAEEFEEWPPSPAR